MGRKEEQLASELREIIQEIIGRGLADPRVAGLITVTAVRVSPDLKSAEVKVSVLPGEKQKLTLHGLRAAAGHIRHEVGSKIRARSIPELHFVEDPSLKKQAAVIEAIRRTGVADRPLPPEEVPPSSAGAASQALDPKP